MAFRPTNRQVVRYPSPEALFNDRKQRSYAGLLSHQADVLRSYQDDALDKPDVAFQMPTGSGKTLVGLLLAEWRRVTYSERPLYLVPTKQLAFQVANEAAAKYDIKVLPLVGSKSAFAPSDQAAWNAGDAIVVTTFNGLFNTSPAFTDPNFIVVDDAHSAENYFSSYWSLHIRKEEEPTLWAALLQQFSKCLPAFDLRRMTDKPRFLDDLVWVDKIPTPFLNEAHDALTAIIDAHVVKYSEKWFAWSVVRNHILACHVYVSCTDILIRPLIMPTSSHSPFTSARQRVYMSATLGQGGDLERLTGRRSIHRIPVPKTWETQGLGRRFFLFLSKSLSEKDGNSLLMNMIRKVPRSTILVPNTARADDVSGMVRNVCGYRVFRVEEIEQSKQPFISQINAVAVLANRYDGIDFPGDECRLLVVDGMTRAVNLQERFIMSRMGAAILYNDRMMTRIVQSFGRCTRSATDYSCVAVVGNEVLSLLSKRDKRALLHPELQAEIEFGLEQSTSTTLSDYESYLEAFLNQRSSIEWQQGGENEIQSLRSNMIQVAPEGAAALSAGVAHEVDFQDRMWNSDYEGALDAGRRVVSSLTGPALNGYRALWNYLAGSAAYLATHVNGRNLEDASKDHFHYAIREATGIPWLRTLSKYSIENLPSTGDQFIDGRIIEGIESIIDRIGTSNDANLIRTEKEIRDGLLQKEKGPFEAAHVLIGQLMGYTAGNKETPGAPDPWWIVHSGLCLIFEDHSNAKSNSLDVTKARQVASHPAWVRANLKLDDNAEIIAVLVSSVISADRDAVPHLVNVKFWSIDDLRSWAERALSAFRVIRNLYPGAPGDLAWRSEARAELARKAVDVETLVAKVRASSAAERLEARL